MTAAATDLSSATVPPRLAVGCSRAALILASVLLAATFFLISPPPGKTYPGAIPWSDFSILRPLTELMSFNGLFVSVRGVEVKDFAFHLIAGLGLALLGVHTLLTPAAHSRSRLGVAAYAQILLAGWVLLSLLSGLWAGDPDIARGQALLYALSLGWAVAVAGSLQRRHLPALLYGVMTISALGAALCVWYYYERNPFHRPGFPLGNPTTLAAAILPGVLIAVALLGETVSRWLHERRPSANWPAAGALVALVPLVWCLALTYARGALLALVVGLAAMVVLLVGRRLRWVFASSFVIGLALVGIWWYSASHLDVTMARGATMRFRLYAWRYAAELWQLRPIAGLGAGSYPRVAGALAVRDRALDPAAFMGPHLGHAHNELFEVLTEIGLVGGVTFVAGFVATFFAASALLRSQAAGAQRWLLLGLVGAVAALLADAMTGVGLRLPGVGPIFFTLLGALWAVCRASPDDAHVDRPEPHSPSQRRRRPTAGTVLTAVICFGAAAGTGWLALRNWSGVQFEYAANAAFEEDRYEDALKSIRSAEPRLLDPVRVVAGRNLALRCRFALAGDAFDRWLMQPTTAPSTDARQHAINLAQQAHAGALRLSLTVPSLVYTDAIAARSAEWLSELRRTSQPRIALDWAGKAGQAWRRQRELTPYDVETLLALTQYRASLEAHVALLRDALRFGRPRGPWLRSLARLAETPGFEEELARCVAASGPITPETDLDAIIASMAPETQRLLAAWHVLRGEYAAAAARAARAARLYRPMRARFPTLQSIALAEQADYVLRGSIEDAPLAVALLREAIDALPIIQAQKYEEVVGPFRLRLTFCLLAAGQVDEALQTLRLILGLHAADPEVVELTLRRLVHDAAASGVPAEHVNRIRRELCPRFPTFCEPGGGQE